MNPSRSNKPSRRKHLIIRLTIDYLAKRTGNIGEQGSVMTEFALTVPVLLLVFTGFVELDRYTLFHQKLDKSTSVVATLAARLDPISEAEIGVLFNSFENFMQPFPFGGNGTVFLSSISCHRRATACTIAASGLVFNWQECRGEATKVSPILNLPCNSNDTPTEVNFPATFSLEPGETVIIAESFYTYDGLIFDFILPEQELYKTSFSRVRPGVVDELQDPQIITPPPTPRPTPMPTPEPSH